MLFKKIHQNIEAFAHHFSSISEERRLNLERLANYIYQKIQEDKTAQLIVICTHNSRRSHIGQLWLAAATSYFTIPNVKTYSGGTEATAFHPNAIKALQSFGFEIGSEKPNAQNPVYNIHWEENQEAYQAFSKRFEDSPNPTKGFSAIMVCSEADKGCPFVAGTDFRIALPFNDPKSADNTPLETETYRERTEQIGIQMTYVLHALKQLLDEK